ncbi:MAG: 30S ribosomal protein S7 [Nitrososphaeria archaeon]|nr:30S ribosomal protein S7 [Nitrososphaeria archaeon]NIN53062.1 30S ribosomal protein S7 [Nitrososphaeria archaeon]NIQ34229.1 30S ribosomal protein S7 [Nitrososphaeria archaeon]
MSSSAPKTIKEIGITAFGRYSYEGIEIRDFSLTPYISLRPALLPWSGGRHEHRKFGKASINIVERLVNKLMRHGKMGGKKAHAINIVKAAFRIIELEMGENPIQVLVRAIENVGPCEDVTTISYGGAVYHVSVDVSPQRRVDVALKNLTNGARSMSHAKRVSIEESLATEIIAASRSSSSSHAVRKRVEIERIAVSSR